MLAGIMTKFSSSWIVMAYMLSIIIPAVIDTHIFVAALRSDGGAARMVLRDALWLESFLQNS
jgi:hypothetical protein